MDEKLMLFYESVEGRFLDLVMDINDFLTEKGCKCTIKPSKTGYTVSYYRKGSKKVLANIVNRKSGVKLRIYASNVKEYESFLDTLPESVKENIRNASVCKRLLNPEDCSSTCPKGYDFNMEGENYKKCRYSAFLPDLSEENNPFLKDFLENELAYENNV